MRSNSVLTVQAEIETQEKEKKKKKGGAERAVSTAFVLMCIKIIICADVLCYHHMC